ncbi:GGDEF domain-containing protein [Thiomicrorhabdus sediminis]|uniref:diguanylate cyclase n=1 Tax=Thiomicrorhabdus sediminis TaxID=2580412 RepID=A0A4P9K4R7_9GAMM|nr:GGDEF domain-containing protein [Thiomicrorhabdus sediminis]QCU89731.1 diguanylate cyclase [Thiomicrorhabdus sediminis]
MFSGNESDFFRLKIFIDKMDDGLIIEDEKADITLTNQAFCNIFDLSTSAEELIGTSYDDFAQNVKHLFKDPEGFVKVIADGLKPKEPVCDQLVEMTSGRYIEIDFTPAYDGDKFLGVVWMFKDLTRHYNKQMELKAISDEMLKQSLTDPLTGIGNRRFLDNKLAELYGYGDPLCIAVIDIDNFKSINDSQGHEAGDYILIHLVNYLMSSLRLSDLIGRMGGDELMIVMPKTTLEDAEKRMMEIHSSYNRPPSSIRQKVTFSAGLACTDRHEDLKSTIASADQALYEAKKYGRNKVVVSVL